MPTPREVPSWSRLVLVSIYKELIFLHVILTVFTCGFSSFLRERVYYMDVWWTLMCYAL